MRLEQCFKKAQAKFLDLFPVNVWQRVCKHSTFNLNLYILWSYNMPVEYVVFHAITPAISRVFLTETLLFAYIKNNVQTVIRSLDKSSYNRKEDQ